MNHFLRFIVSGLCCILFSCTVSKQPFNPDKKFSPEKLQQDYKIFRNILEQDHPSLYWYTSKDSMDYFFAHGYAQIRDSMTETQFKTLLSYVITKINCGHTSVKSSRQYLQYLDTAKVNLFPLSLKFWDDTMVVAANINRDDSFLIRGTILRSINGWTQQQLRDTLFNYLVTDGYSMTAKYQSLSSFFNFGNLYDNIFGLPEKLTIHYLDGSGSDKETIIPLYDAKLDTLKHRDIFTTQMSNRTARDRKRLFLFATRNLQIDTALNTAFMTVNTFSRGNHLKSFFRSSFKLLDKINTGNLVIDVRANGGGDASNSTLLTRYIIDKKFKMADSLYAVSRHNSYDKYIEKSFLYRALMLFVTKKHSDGKYHFGYFERHYFHPKKNHHFEGQVYILIGGNSFSATSLFAGCLKGQKNVTLVGEETGGGYYGNTAWVIQDVTLPNTAIRFRLPKFRLVVDKTREKNGHGVLPDVMALPSAEAIRKGIDFKAEKAKELIRERKDQNK